MGAVTYSLVIPVYKNADSIDQLVDAVAGIDDALSHELEVVFVVDSSPDQSFDRLAARLSQQRFRAKLLLLSRNFGSFAAIRTGLAAATGRYFAVMAADLQEPPRLILEFFSSLSREDVDVTLGVRTKRSDPWASRTAARLFWWTYRRFVQREVPAGGIDVFGCNLAFREHLLRLDETNSSLVGQIIWLGFRRKLVPYERLPRQRGENGLDPGPEDHVLDGQHVRVFRFARSHTDRDRYDRRRDVHRLGNRRPARPHVGSDLRAWLRSHGGDDRLLRGFQFPGARYRRILHMASL